MVHLLRLHFAGLSVFLHQSINCGRTTLEFQYSRVEILKTIFLAVTNLGLIAELVELLSQISHVVVKVLKKQMLIKFFHLATKIMIRPEQRWVRSPY